jgi:hypothetical protein
MFALFNARPNSRRNPAKVPAAMLTRSTLDAVGKAYSTRKLVPDSNPDAAVLRDYMLDLGIETLSTPDTPDFQEKQGSALHRWIVLDAIESAESVPQRDTWKAVIAAARAWVNDPSERNRLNAEHMKDIGYKERNNEAVSRRIAIVVGRPAASSAVSATTASRNTNYSRLGSIGGAHSAAHAAYAAASARSTSALTAYDSALTRYRILVHLAEAGVLPEPPVQRHNPRR